MSEDRWWRSLDPEVLAGELPPELMTRWKIVGIDGAGSLLTEYLDPGASRMAGTTYWTELKREFRALVCTEDEKYADVRRSLGSAGAEARVIAVAVISAAIGAELGFAAGALAPFCLLCLIALVRLGKEAFCTDRGWDDLEPK